MLIRGAPPVVVLILLIALAILRVPVATEGQGKIWRIGSVLTGSAETVAPVAKAMEVSLATLGYVNGRNITLVQQVAPPHPGGAEETIRALVPNIDILIVGGTVGGVAAKKVTTLPTVFLTVGDPVRIGLVSSLAHPGGKMTGVTFEAAAETYGKRLQRLKEILPDLRRVGILRAVRDANITVAMESLERAAPKLSVTLRSFDITSVDDLTSAFATMKAGGVQAVLVVAGAFTYAHGRRIAELALTNRLPSCGGFRETVAAGGLMSLGPDLMAMAPQVAAYVDKIIRGAKPGDLPVEQPVRYEMYVNLKTAKALGVRIPEALLARADVVIQ
jgi:putative tryptophan/tyrosine transport system substrate-binding protein